MTKQCQHLNTKERKILLILLNKFEGVFDSTLGMWNTTPEDLELRDNTKPVYSRYYPVRRIHEEMFRRERKDL